jgi:hypothetical protein
MLNQKNKVMKNLKFKSIAVLTFVFGILAFTSCNKDDVSNNVSNDGYKSVTVDSIDGYCYTSLQYMREEEKLAHDVYVYLYDLWNVPIFNNISKAETVHTNAIKGLLTYFDIEDPALPGEGEFSNPELQDLYNTLIEAGSGSLVDALTVGATIEEVDIIDLDNAMDSCDVDTIDVVYDRLRTGSTHHLKAFVAWLSSQGVDYQPQYLSQEEFDEIINGDGHHDDDTTTVSLTEEEAAGILFMREEEKLAHDVYVNMYNMWGLKTFLFISKSETMHTNKVLGLIEYYGLEDPALPGNGEFSNEELQNLYNDLMAQGSDSLIAALKVGATIEEVDILDLWERLEQTDKLPITRVYSHLEKGSEHHLRAFVYQLKLRGVEYEPQYLTQEQYDAIIGG